MRERRVVPPGFVDGYCTTCQADVLFPMTTMACRQCGQTVDPLSLPTVPKNYAAIDVPRPIREPEPAARLVLPDWIKEVRSWHAATMKLADQLAEEEATALSELRRVRGLRKLVDAVLDRIEPT